MKRYEIELTEKEVEMLVDCLDTQEKVHRSLERDNLKWADETENEYAYKLAFEHHRKAETIAKMIRVFTDTTEGA